MNPAKTAEQSSPMIVVAFRTRAKVVDHQAFEQIVAFKLKAHDQREVKLPAVREGLD